MLWTNLFLVIQKISLFLVQLLSVTRSIAIARPFYKIQKKAVFGSVGVYLVLMIIQEVTQYQNVDYR